MPDSRPAIPPSAAGDEIASRAGVGFKLEHAADIARTRPDLGWFEVHPENYMVPGGPRPAALEALRRDYPLSFHGVGLSLGGSEPLDREHLRALRALADRFQPALVSEHLAWSAWDGVYFADLLPLPLDRAALERLSDRVDQVQEALGRRILVENPSHYLALPESEMTEPDFLEALARRSGCGLLVDINNIHVSAVNVGIDAEASIDAIPTELIGEVHLAGHAVEQRATGRLLIDNHGAPVAPEVWRLYERLLERAGPLPTLVEWDSDVPAWSELHAEAGKAEERLQRVAVLASEAAQ